jgi:hypothetical protein
MGRAGTVLLALAVATLPAQELPAGLARTLIDRFGLTPVERGTIGGIYEAVVSLPSTSPDGIAARGAIAIEAHPEAYLAWAEAGPEFDIGSSVQAVRQLSTPPRLSDFDTLVLSKDDLRELQRCRPHACAMQLDESSIARIAAIEWRQPDAAARANAIVREMMFGIAARYASSGDAALLQYHDSTHPTDVRAEFDAIAAEEAAAGAMPSELLAFLRGRPGATLPRASSYLYWTTSAFGLKPTTRLNHTVVYRGGGDGVAGIVTTKMLYASHYFHGGLDVRYVVADPASPGRFALLIVTRTRSDGLTGLTGAVIGDSIRRKGIQALRKYLRFTKDTVERRQRLGWTGAPPR